MISLGSYFREDPRGRGLSPGSMWVVSLSGAVPRNPVLAQARGMVMDLLGPTPETGAVNQTHSTELFVQWGVPNPDGLKLIHRTSW